MIILSQCTILLEGIHSDDKLIICSTDNWTLSNDSCSKNRKSYIKFDTLTFQESHCVDSLETVSTQKKN